VEAKEDAMEVDIDQEEEAARTRTSQMHASPPKRASDTCYNALYTGLLVRVEDYRDQGC
jgi:hypothetical protein